MSSARINLAVQIAWGSFHGACTDLFNKQGDYGCLDFAVLVVRYGDAEGYEGFGIFG